MAGAAGRAGCATLRSQWWASRDRLADQAPKLDFSTCIDATIRVCDKANGAREPGFCRPQIVRINCRHGQSLSTVVQLQRSNTPSLPVLPVALRALLEPAKPSLSESSTLQGS